MPFDIDSVMLRMRTAARIDEDPRGGPVRTIINGRHRKPTGRYSSAKAARALPWESKHERSLFMLCEADTRVVSYLAQPHRLTIPVGRDESLVYYPDLRREMAVGPTEIIEVKKAYDPQRDPFYDRKIGLAQDVYTGLGWAFRVMDAAEIEAEPAWSTARAIQRYRHVALTTRDRLTAMEAVEAAGGVTTVAAAVEALGGGSAAHARLCALVVRRVVAIDLGQRLGPGSTVTLVSSTPDAPRPRRRA